MDKKIKKCWKCGSTKIIDYGNKIRCRNCGLLDKKDEEILKELNAESSEMMSEDEWDAFFAGIGFKKKPKT